MIGERLSELRKNKRMSQERLGMILHVSQSAISTYENNEREAPDAIKVEIAKIFGVTVRLSVRYFLSPEFIQLLLWHCTKTLQYSLCTERNAMLS